MNKFIINKKTITIDTPPYIIAEVGHNHQGSVDLCKNIFLEAKDVELQLLNFRKEIIKKFFSKRVYNRIYNSDNSYGKTYGQHREFLEFGFKEYLAI